jgi:hypothetical protein
VIDRYIGRMSDPDSATTWRQWLWTAVAWDGCLPLLAASSRAVVPFFVRDKFFASLVAVVGIPLLTALVRAGRGKEQLKRFAGSTALWRQVVLAAAILVLILFEMLMAILLGADLEFISLFLAAVIYFIYLALVALAMWPVAVPEG